MKSKTTAILLSIFFGFWTWLYTYRVDKKKFWICLSIVLVLVLTLMLISAFSTETGNYLDAFAGVLSGMLLFFIILIVCFAFWLWALIDRSIKRDEFYSNYPNG